MRNTLYIVVISCTSAAAAIVHSVASLYMVVSSPSFADMYSMASFWYTKTAPAYTDLITCNAQPPSAILPLLSSTFSYTYILCPSFHNHAGTAFSLCRLPPKTLSYIKVAGSTKRRTEGRCGAGNVANNVRCCGHAGRVGFKRHQGASAHVYRWVRYCRAPAL